MSRLSLDEYNRRATKYGAKRKFRGVVMSLHGMLARGRWQTEISPELQIAGFLHVPLDLGYITVGVVGPLARYSAQKAESLIRRQYNRYIEEIEAVGGLSILAHSFGTYCAAFTLLRSEWMMVDRVIFVGSIVKPDYPWDRVIETSGVKRVLNEVGHKDFWVKIAPMAIGSAGDSGVKGFDSDSDIVFNHVHPHTDHHSLFDIGYARDTWIPFLSGEKFD